MEAIICAIITSVLSLIGVVVSNVHSKSAITTQLTTMQAVTDTKLSLLTEEVKRHNNFAMRMPVVEEQIRAINCSVTDITKRVHDLEQAD